MDLFGIDVDEGVPVDLVEAGVVYVRRKREGLVRGTDGAGDEAGAAIPGGELVSHAAGELGALHVDFAHEVFGGVVSLADAVGAEGVGFGDVGSGLEIGAVDRFRHLGLGQRKDVVVALLVLGQAQRPGVVRLGQLEVLDLGAKRAIGDEDALRGLFKEGGAGSRRYESHAAFSSAGALGRRPSRWQIA